mmetsp:Transcript_44670/g.105969  ORF Transcript_44670/g.105969 Transcript_44670/m.105969 type:complete len:453 (+) Transcript_44670:103-1461(+)
MVLTWRLSYSILALTLLRLATCTSGENAPRIDWAALEAPLQKIVAGVSSKYNCSVSLAVRGADGKVTVAAGGVDAEANRPATTSDVYAWGSVTKSLTGASIMSLISQGKLSLDSQVAPIVDPLLAEMRGSDPSQNFSSMAELWGAENVSSVTVRDLLGMQSGIPDFDTAKPTKEGLYEDSLRAFLYSNPTKAYKPSELMSVPWVRDHYAPCASPMHMCYSSTNFLLLGMVLASSQGAKTWRELKQESFLPPDLRSQVQFIMHGSPVDNAVVSGYDRTAYNMPKGDHNNKDVGGVDGVFAGWTASDIVATPATVADLAWEIYGPSPRIAPKSYVDQMIPRAPMQIYGLATFNLGMTTGHNGTLGAGYGHLGATYGYQSVMGYFPALGISLAVATNIETDMQAQPSETVCFSYNTIVAAALGEEYDCHMESKSFYFQICVCQKKLQEEDRTITV